MRIRVSGGAEWEYSNCITFKAKYQAVRDRGARGGGVQTGSTGNTIATCGEERQMLR
jgi:hypothetical protein